MTSELVKNIAETAAGYFGAPSLSVSVVSGGEKFEASLGCTERSVFQIGEISKTFLCSALRTSGIDMERPVTDISSWFRMSSEELTRQVTLKDIILQRTGLPPHEASWFFNPQLSYRELTGRIRYLDTAFGLRERWCRQDHLFAAASCVLEDVTGKKWNSYCMDQTIRPAGLASTFCSVADMEESGYQDVAAAHLSAYGQTAEVSLWMTDLLAGGGSMLSCTEDLAEWTDKNAGNVLAESIAVPGEELFGFPPSAVGVREVNYSDGWFIMDMLGEKLICSFGKVGGSAVFTGKVVGHDLSFAAAAGIGVNFCTEAVGFAICEEAIRGEHSDWNKRMTELGKAVYNLKRARNSSFLRRCTDDVFSPSISGKYRNEGYGEIELKEEFGRLFLTVFGLPMRIYATDSDIRVLDATQLLGYALPCRITEERAEILLEPECSEMICFRRQ